MLQIIKSASIMRWLYTYITTIYTKSLILFYKLTKDLIFFRGSTPNLISQYLSPY
ncbi:hypothetical protein MtrunA17_Chr5g0409321 [Medicago truncatula]|uniref:Transmembrane protein n=1 Tax=Medicago truncatula TaxID=3880 RepID=A0A396HQB9_MEDTR|nr:hypothetical protein MtrunA17_Chr5g0409321 [Medicago truncatula]